MDNQQDAPEHAQQTAQLPHHVQLLVQQVGGQNCTEKQRMWVKSANRKGGTKAMSYITHFTALRLILSTCSVHTACVLKRSVHTYKQALTMIYCEGFQTFI